MYPLHYAGVKLMDLKNKFGIKDATTNHIPGADIRKHDMGAKITAEIMDVEPKIRYPDYYTIP